MSKILRPTAGGKVPTLLELAQTLQNRPKPPTLLEPSSDESDLDQPPVATKKPEEKNLVSPQSPIVQKHSPTTRRKSFLLHRGGKKLDQSCANNLSDKNEEINQEPTEEISILLRSSTSKKIANQSDMEPTKRYTTFRAREDVKLHLPKICLPFSSKNYQIKEVRRGIPKIVKPNQQTPTTNRRPKLEPTSYCVCLPKSKNKKKPSAWLFSCITVFLCIVFPLASFATDIAFFIECSDHYNETRQLLDMAHYQLRSYTDTSTLTNLAENATARQIHVNEEVKRVPAPFKERNVGTELSNFQNSGIKLPSPDSNSLRYNAVGTAADTKNKNAQAKFSEVSSSSPSDHPEYHGLIDSVISAHCFTQIKAPVCNTESNLLAYMTSKNASQKLRSHKRVTADVFEPVFILGTFPCLVLSIFTRLVVMITNHDDFVSAYVVNMLCMPLQLVTGALAVHSASYHVGPNGFECWKCAVGGNCSDIDALSFMKDHLTNYLIATTIAKFLDGIAGGCVLFVVLARKIWVKNSNHLSCWWYCCRLWVSIAALLFCVVVSSSMVLTPSLGVFRLEMMEKTAYFQGKNFVCYGSMTLLAMGLTAWCASLSILCLYLSFKTYVYCRRKEHIDGEDMP